MKIDCKRVVVKNGILDAQCLAKILSVLEADGLVLVTGVKKLELPTQFLKACLESCEAN
jgi:hypothetical protein